MMKCMAWMYDAPDRRQCQQETWNSSMLCFQHYMMSSLKRCRWRTLYS
jgi:hypothetical protein